MFIRQIVIEGAEGDVEIRRDDGGPEGRPGALVIANGVEQFVGRDDSREQRWGVACNAARVLCGSTRRGEPNATNSMIHDVLNEIERVAGC